MSKPNWALLAIPAGLAAYWFSKNRPKPGPDPDPEIDCPPGWDLVDGQCVEPYIPDPDPMPDPDPDPMPDPDPDPMPAPDPVGATDAPWDGQLLAKGATGPLVTALQRVLCFLGHGSPFGNKDDVDIFGPKTRSAVKSFQTAAGIMSDGKVDAGTTLALDDACRAQGVTVGQAAEIPCGETGGSTEPEDLDPITVTWGTGGSGISFSSDCRTIDVSNQWINDTAAYIDYVLGQPDIAAASSSDLAQAMIWGGQNYGGALKDIQPLVEDEHPSKNLYGCPSQAIDQIDYHLANLIASRV